MIRELFTFRPADICLILLFAVFALAITIGLIICNREELKTAARRGLFSLTLWMEDFTRRMRDDIPYEEWMSYREWKETR